MVIGAHVVVGLHIPTARIGVSGILESVVDGNQASRTLISTTARQLRPEPSISKQAK